MSWTLRRVTERPAAAPRPWRLRAGWLLGAVAALALNACAGVDPARVPRTNLITGSTGGSWYAIGSAISERTNVAFSGHPITAVPGAGG